MMLKIFSVVFFVVFSVAVIVPSFIGNLSEVYRKFIPFPIFYSFGIILILRRKQLKEDHLSVYFFDSNKEHSKLDRRERGLMKGSENIGVCSKNTVIVFGATLRRRMRAREMDKKEPLNHI